MDGVLVINKPKGYSSHDIVNIVKRECNKISPEKIKVGHAGTLDPNATGVLPILIGKGTKISKYLIEHNKTYIAELVLGKKTTTADIEGEIIEEKEIPLLNLEDVQKIFKSFLGKQKQTPPVYSAIKVNGKKAYEYARSGKEIEIEERDIEIYDIRLISFNKNKMLFEVNCSKGTYIRTLCEDIAEKMGTVGYMSNLNRTKVNEFNIENVIELEQIKENPNIILEKIINIEEIFKNIRKIELDNYKKKLFLNGVKLRNYDGEEVVKIYNNNIFLGVGIIKDGTLKRDVII